MALLGAGMAEGPGLLSAIIGAHVLSTPRRFITPIEVIAGILSDAASEANYVILIPLAAAIFRAL